MTMGMKWNKGNFGTKNVFVINQQNNFFFFLQIKIFWIQQKIFEKKKKKTGHLCWYLTFIFHLAMWCMWYSGHIFTYWTYAKEV